LKEDEEDEEREEKRREEKRREEKREKKHRERERETEPIGGGSTSQYGCVPVARL
jgi:hypothetical protein